MLPEKNLTDSTLYRVSTADPLKLIPLCAESMLHWIRRYGKIRPDYSIPLSMLKDLKEVRLSYNDTVSVLSLAFFFTIFRYFCQWKAQGYVHSCGVFPRFAHKVPESCWKLFYYGLSWIFSLYIHTCIPSIDTFYDPLSMWKDFSDGNIPPIHPTVYFVYLTQSAFYLHSIYATLFMDLWRKDSWLMFTHHFIALALIWLSYIEGCTLPGAFVLFLQDNTDALLEMIKLAMYFKKRTDGRFYKSLYISGNFIFVAFAVAWVIFRLYWYPCKLLYATLYGGVYLGPQDGKFMPLLGVMLIIIYGMNVYWFNFIIRMVWRVASTGEDPEDNREYDTTAVSGLDQQKLDLIAAKKTKSRKKKE